MPTNSQDHLAQFAEQLDRCMLCDAPALRGMLRDLRRRRKQGKSIEQSQRSFEDRLKASLDRREERGRRLPKPMFPDDLPVAQRRGDIARAITDNQVVVVCGETGSGKTTQIPKICLELRRGVSGVIGHTQPRRLAARSLAARVARELNTTVGRAVGYKIRFGDRTSPDSYVKIMTDGILLAETQGDRALRQYDTLIIDEAHERSLNVDFLLGYLKRLLPRRPDLKLIITSATIDPHRFSEHFDGAPIVEVSGRTYPVEVRYRPVEAEDASSQDRDQRLAIVHAVDELAECGLGDVLIFLPGERDIRETAEALRKHHPPQTEILPLYARLSAKEQDRVFRPHAGRRLVLATNVAETSLTVPGIKYVVDPGLARMSRYSARSRVQRLPIEPVSQASANQRKGRCGRLSDGVCIRLYSEADFDTREAYTPPEILRTNLAAVILQMKALHLGNVEDFPFIDPPDKRNVRDGYYTLRELGAVDERGDLTRLGRDLSRLPIDPRLGRMLLAAEHEGALREVLIIAAALSIQDPRERPMEVADAADQAHEQFQDEESDFLSLLKLWDFYHEQARHLSQNKMRKLCRTNFLSYLRMREWHDIHSQLKVLLTGMGHHLSDTPAEYENIHRALLAGLPSHIGLLDERHEYRGAEGRRFHIFPGSSLFKKTPKWIVAAEMVQTTRLYARSVARIDPAWLERVAPHLVKKTHSEPLWDEGRACVNAKERVSLYGLPIVSARRVHYGPINPTLSRELFIHHALVEREFHTKAAFFRHNAEVAEKIRSLQAKIRQANILVDPEHVYQFYDRRIPGDIYNGSRFERWRKDAEREDPQLLFMTEQDLMQRSADEITPQSYPDEMLVGETRCRLVYRMSPGEVDDGVTLQAPIVAASHLSQQRADWLVPGLLEEKITLLLRGLPKPLRRNFVPVPDFARACVQALQPSDGPLTDAIASYLAKMTGVTIPRDAWNLDALPDHLRLHVQIEDEHGESIAVGDDVETLKRQARDSFQVQLADVDDTPWNRDGITEWDFGDLPTQVMVEQGGLSVAAYPALVDAGDTAALRLLDSSENAARENRAGLRRLIELQIRKELQFQIEHLPQYEKLLLHTAPVMPAEKLRRRLADLVVERAYLAGKQVPRSIAAFKESLEQGWGKLATAAAEVGQLTGNLLTQRHAIAVKLDAAGPALSAIVADVSEQLTLLMPDDFLLSTPWEWLQQFPRYLKAIQYRLQKIETGGLDRDGQRLADLQPHWQALVELWSACADVDRGLPEIQTLRWMMEELRVSLFAQELGTALPVSLKRIAKQFEVAARS